MALVNYSDSETSDIEESATASVPKPSASSTSKPSSKANFPKLTNSSGPRRIKVDLPTVQPEPERQDGEEASPAKKARTAGAFSGFNSLLPAPKRTAAQNAPKAGVSLKTSSEAAFSRNPVPRLDDGEDGDVNGIVEDASKVAREVDGKEPNMEEVKPVGKVTKFKPLSVANRKKPVAKKSTNDGQKQEGIGEKIAEQNPVRREEVATEVTQPPPPPKPKRSLFSVPQEENETPSQTSAGTYESITTNSHLQNDGDDDEESVVMPQQQQSPANHPQPNSNSLDALTSDLNLTPAQRRQLFGRNAKDNNINIAHFNMEAEYAANEQLRQTGEVVEHRAVKAIAPGKHSLQQLVNNARSQQEAMEDKWAQGRKDRGDGGSRYGWGK